MKLTIAQILPALESGGVERGTLEIAQAIVRNGHRSIVFSAGGRLVPRLVEQGSEHISLPAGKKSVTVFLYIRHLARLLLTEKVDILHARSRLPAWIAWFALKRLPENKRPAFITTVHGQYSVNSYSKIMLRGDRIIAPSQYICDYIHRNFPDTDMNRVQVIHRGVSRKDFPWQYRPDPSWLDTWQQQFPELEHHFVITLAARLTRLKGQEDFINIVKRARLKGLPVHGLIVGGTVHSKRSYRRDLLRLVQEGHLENHITFLGQRDDLREIMAVSDVVMSLSKYPEAFGRTVLEALSIGTPVIAYHHGGVAEILNEIFPQGAVRPFDFEGCVEKLQEFYRQPPAVTDHNPFTLEAMQESTLKLYESFAARA